MVKQLLLCLECLTAVQVAGVDILEIRKPFNFGIQTAAAATSEQGFLVALVAEEVLARVRHHSYVDWIRTNWAYLCLLLKPKRVQLSHKTITLTTAASENTSSSSQGGSSGYLLSSAINYKLYHPNIAQIKSSKIIRGRLLAFIIPFKPAQLPIC